MKKFSWSVFAIKITSRKLWVSITGLVTSIMAYENCNSNTIVQVTAIIMALGSVVGYLIANGLTDDAADTTSTDSTAVTASSTGAADSTAAAASSAAVSTAQDAQNASNSAVTAEASAAK